MESLHQQYLSHVEKITPIDRTDGLVGAVSTMLLSGAVLTGTLIAAPRLPQEILIIGTVPSTLLLVGSGSYIQSVLTEGLEEHGDLEQLELRLGNPNAPKSPPNLPECWTQYIDRLDFSDLEAACEHLTVPVGRMGEVSMAKILQAELGATEWLPNLAYSTYLVEHPHTDLTAPVAWDRLRRRLPNWHTEAKELTPQQLQQLMALDDLVYATRAP